MKECMVSAPNQECAGEYLGRTRKLDTVGESPTYKFGYECGLKAGIYNTLVYLEENGYIDDSDFMKLEKEIEKDNENNLS